MTNKQYRSGNTLTGYNGHNTPIEFFNELNKEFNFQLDPCTTKDNPLHTPYYYTYNTLNGLSHEWVTWTFCNPPYNNIEQWITKGLNESNYNNKKSVFLLPVRTRSNWFTTIWQLYKNQYKSMQEDISIEIRWIKKRLKFGYKNVAKFDSMLVIFK